MQMVLLAATDSITTAGDTDGPTNSQQRKV
jgi:hypothetical protein